MSAGRSDLVDLEVVLRRETDLAFGIMSPNKAGEIIWLPKSQCELEGGEPPTNRGTITCPEWLAVEKHIETLARGSGQ